MPAPVELCVATVAFLLFVRVNEEYCVLASSNTLTICSRVKPVRFVNCINTLCLVALKYSKIFTKILWLHFDRPVMISPRESLGRRFFPDKSSIQLLLLQCSHLWGYIGYKSLLSNSFVFCCSIATTPSAIVTMVSTINQIYTIHPWYFPGKK